MHDVGAQLTQHAGPSSADPTGMGYQPALDGLRAVSVVAVILYHAGFGWMSGGFFGVEVFFVISGYLITVLLIEEHARSGGVSLRAFWVRRARRLLPALGAVLIATSVWVAWFGSREQAAQMRHDLPWAIAYAANWGQIESGTPYFAAGSPPMLRHLWSLAVEEQWYVVWPLVFVVLARRLSARRTAVVLLGAVGVAALLSWWIRHGRVPFGPPRWAEDDLVNLAYLSTPTRAGGLLLGAALAFAWQPWRQPAAEWRARIATPRALDRLGAAAVIALVSVFVMAHLTASVVYPWLLLSVSVLSAVVIGVVVHPGDHRLRRMLSSGLLVGIGRRSYGLYLWHWPVFVVLGATEGSWSRAIVATTVAVVLTELSLHLVEARFRRPRAWTAAPRRLAGRLVPATSLGVVVVAIGVHYASNVDAYDVAAGDDAATFELRQVSLTPTVPSPIEPATTTTLPTTATVATSTSTTSPPQTTAPPSTSSTSTSTSTVPTTAPRPPLALPIRLGIVGDSQAHSLAINLPDGIEEYFDVDDGSLDGCGVIDRGDVRSVLTGFRSEFGRCSGWQDRWASTAEDNDVVLVVLGAWEVFDIGIGDEVVRFGSPAHDRMLTAALADGLDRITSAGAVAAVLEVPCMRPVESSGARVPPLPERGDDARTRHLDELFRSVVADHPGALFVDGPDWCTDEEIATDVDYRWDGVHVYRRGANYVYEAIAPRLLQIAGVS
jgi:peptidoglycan/LPS O-acetylase OafA/YrhL